LTHPLPRPHAAAVGSHQHGQPPQDEKGGDAAEKGPRPAPRAESRGSSRIRGDRSATKEMAANCFLVMVLPFIKRLLMDFYWARS
ncbi:MAG: hypothetical protein LUG57_06075, partial [Oscillospiraceae bacterium]|nr:hypothetical protein [Oscillospiraceae bacterium]